MRRKDSGKEGTPEHFIPHFQPWRMSPISKHWTFRTQSTPVYFVCLPRILNSLRRGFHETVMTAHHSYRDVTDGVGIGDHLADEPSSRQRLNKFNFNGVTAAVLTVFGGAGYP